MHVELDDVFGVEFLQQIVREAWLLARFEQKILAEIVMLGTIGLGVIASENDGLGGEASDGGLFPPDQWRGVTSYCASRQSGPEKLNLDGSRTVVERDCAGDRKFRFLGGWCWNQADRFTGNETF